MRCAAGCSCKHALTAMRCVAAVARSTSQQAQRGSCVAEPGSRLHWASTVLRACTPTSFAAVLFIKVTVARNWSYHLLNTILPVRRC